MSFSHTTEGTALKWDSLAPGGTGSPTIRYAITPDQLKQESAAWNSVQASLIQVKTEAGVNIWYIKARSLARRLRLHALFAKVRHAINPHRDREFRVNEWLRGTVKPGDTVWDVGANVGDYTVELCQWVGPKGRVIAFEPNPDAAAMITERLKDCAWISIENVALGSREEEATLAVEPGYTRSGHVMTGGSGIPIQVMTGDAASARLGIPQLVKIDVEGFEEDVLLGLKDTLRSIQSIVIEVHFHALESRGHAEAPIRIERLLKNEGFRLRWVDRSHLVGER